MIIGWVLFVAVSFKGHEVFVFILPFLDTSTIQTGWSINFNPLIALMTCVVTTVSFLVHLYSVEYMKHDDSQPRFMAYLSLFTFMMLMLITANDLVQVFFGWEGVGLASYLLIGFWYTKPSANEAALKAFIVNRIGDLGLILGLCSIFYLFETTEIGKILSGALLVVEKESFLLNFGLEINSIEVTCILLFIGAAGKSAQIGLHTWLPDAMEGPTPVSALIHAATMVTAGVFLLARFSQLYDLAPIARSIITLAGATTAVFAGTVAIVQNDIKRVIAYSTCSQLGYMFLASGLSNYSASIFHLTTHAFFKALLFLGSGCIIHALSGEQNMKKMGGIWKSVIMTYSMMMIGSLTLIGFPPFSGFFSKEMILETVLTESTAIGRYSATMSLIAAVLTAIYSTRLLCLTFHGKRRFDQENENIVSDPGSLMKIPLAILAIGALTIGLIGKNYVISDDFWRSSILISENHGHHLSSFLGILPIMMEVIGVSIALYVYIFSQDFSRRLREFFSGTYRFLCKKWYFDEIYSTILVKPCLKVGRFLWISGDGTIIDGIGPDGVSSLIGKLSSRLRLLQTGFLNHYATMMVTSVVFLVGILCIKALIIT